MAKDGNTILSNLDSGSLNGIVLDGTFSMVSQDAIDASNVDGQVQTLVLKLKEVDRGTGSYQTITAAAFLEVDVDMNLIHSFNPTSDGANLDDSHGLAEAHMGTDPTIDLAKRAAASQFRLNLNNYLNDPTNLAANTSYDSVGQTLSSSWFPAGAIVLDLDKEIDTNRLTGNVQITDAGGLEKSFLVASDQMEAGVMMYARVIINCGAAMPQISGETTFKPTGAVIGGDSGANEDGLKIVLTGLDNYSLAQVLTVAVDSTSNGAIKITEAGADPQSPDIFEEVIQLDDLIGAGTVGEHMSDAVIAAIGVNANLIKSFKLQVDAIAHASDSSFSGFCRELAKGAGRTNEDPFKAGDKFIISNTGSLVLNVQPFQYSFSEGQGQVSGSIYSVATLEMFKSDMPVYAVLKQSATPAPMMAAANGSLHA